MNKLISWVLGFTKLGKVVTPVQQFLSGKKTNLAGAAIAVPALITILSNFADQGIQYAMTLPKTPEWDQLMVGIGMVTMRAAIAKAGNPAADPNAK